MDKIKKYIDDYRSGLISSVELSNCILFHSSLKEKDIDKTLDLLNEEELELFSKRIKQDKEYPNTIRSIYVLAKGKQDSEEEQKKYKEKRAEVVNLFYEKIKE